jgi:beta-glucosidase
MELHPARHLVCLAVLAALAAPVRAQGAAPDIEGRIDALLRRMTVEEKVGQLTQHDGVKPETLELVKQGKLGSLLNVIGADATNAVQRVAVEQSRLKIPVIFGYDVIHGYRTIFPVPLAGACSFDLPLLTASERVAAKEAAAGGIKWVFAPMVDIARDPRWGRIVEGAGEDPFLGAQVAAARVRGFQGERVSDPDSVVACAKHFAAYGAAEGGRDYNTVDISEQLLREVYLPPFKAAVDAGVRTFMAAFNDLNGVPAHANHHLLGDILRGEWGFGGLVVSDYNAVHELVIHGVAADDAEAARKALSAGIDMDMVDDAYRDSLPALLESGRVPMAALDQAVRRVLRLKLEAGVFDAPYADKQREAAQTFTAEGLAVSRKLAQESMVLLKNEGGLLPIGAGKTLAVIGPLADDKAAQLGPWSGDGQAKDAVTPLEGLRARFGEKAVVHVKGCDLESYPDRRAGGPAPAPESATGARSVAPGRGRTSLDDAVEAAKRADVVLLFMGELADMSGEAATRSFLDFPGAQQQLMEAIVATGKPVALIVESGRPLDLRWANERIPAILQAWFPGSQAGHAIADLLSGDVSPSGRLVVSWPRSVGQIPIYYNHRNTGRPPTPGRWDTGHQDETIEPLYPFGHGLTYTQFRYGAVTVSTPRLAATDTLRVSAEIENTGTVAGTEVVQLYVRNRVGPTSRPVRELKGFARVTLAPGERRRVELSVPANELGSYDPAMKWVVPAGTYDVWIAPDASRGSHATFLVAGP